VSTLITDVRCPWCGDRRDWPAEIGGCATPADCDRLYAEESTELLVALDRRWDQ
jgi:hypothetical protein